MKSQIQQKISANDIVSDVLRDGCISTQSALKSYLQTMGTSILEMSKRFKSPPKRTITKLGFDNKLAFNYFLHYINQLISQSTSDSIALSNCPRDLSKMLSVINNIYLLTTTTYSKVAITSTIGRARINTSEVNWQKTQIIEISRYRQFIYNVTYKIYEKLKTLSPYTALTKAYLNFITSTVKLNNFIPLYSKITKIGNNFIVINPESMLRYLENTGKLNKVDLFVFWEIARTVIGSLGIVANVRIANYPQEPSSTKFDTSFLKKKTPQIPFPPNNAAHNIQFITKYIILNCGIITKKNKN